MESRLDDIDAALEAQPTQEELVSVIQVAVLYAFENHEPSQEQAPDTSTDPSTNVDDGSAGGLPLGDLFYDIVPRN